MFGSVDPTPQSASTTAAADSAGSSFGFSFGGPAGDADVAASTATADAGAAWAPPGAGVGAAAAQSFMRRAGEEELREMWVKGRREARAAFKKRSADTARQQRLRSRGTVTKRGK